MKVGTSPFNRKWRYRSTRRYAERFAQQKSRIRPWISRKYGVYSGGTLKGWTRNPRRSPNSATLIVSHTFDIGRSLRTTARATATRKKKASGTSSRMNSLVNRNRNVMLRSAPLRLDAGIVPHAPGELQGNGGEPGAALCEFAFSFLPCAIF